MTTIIFYHAAVYDGYGKMIEMLTDKIYSPDNYILEWNATDIPVGIYYVCIEKQENVDIIKVLRVK